MANRTAVGPWEQYLLNENSDGSYSFKSFANSKYVTAPTGAGPLIASSTSIGTNEKFNFLAIPSYSPDAYKIQSRMNNYWLCTQSQLDNTILPVGSMYSNTYLICVNKFMGYSASTIANNAYIWNIYITDASTVSFFFKALAAPPTGTTATLYIDNQYKGSVPISGTYETSHIDVSSSNFGNYLHNVKIQFNHNCSLDYFRWDFPVGTK